MPAKCTLNISLTQPLRNFVEEQVRSGRFQTASEVVRHALRLLHDDHQRAAGENGSSTGPAVEADLEQRSGAGHE